MPASATSRTTKSTNRKKATTTRSGSSRRKFTEEDGTTRCIAVTTRGSRCSFCAVEGSKLCGTHVNLADASPTKTPAKKSAKRTKEETDTDDEKDTKKKPKKKKKVEKEEEEEEVAEGEEVDTPTKAAKKRRVRSSSKLETNDSDDEWSTLPTTGMSNFLQKVSKDKSKKAAAMITASSDNVARGNEQTSHWVRRSVREVGQGDLDNPHVIELLTNLRLQDESMEVLKLKKVSVDSDLAALLPLLLL